MFVIRQGVRTARIAPQIVVVRRGRSADWASVSRQQPVATERAMQTKARTVRLALRIVLVRRGRSACWDNAEA